jgi:hypothetical protein
MTKVTAEKVFLALNTPVPGLGHSTGAYQRRDDAQVRRLAYALRVFLYQFLQVAAQVLSATPQLGV